jgi:hypothetical protein
MGERQTGGLPLAPTAPPFQSRSRLFDINQALLTGFLDLVKCPSTNALICSIGRFSA